MERLIRLTALCFLAWAFASNPTAFAADKEAKDSKPKKEAGEQPSEKADKDQEADEDKDEDKDKDSAEDKDKDKEEDKDKEKKDKDKDTEKSPDAKPKTHKVEKEPFKIEIELSGVFEAKRMEGIVLRPKQWTSLKVLDAVKHGQRVKKGELLVKFDMEKIDREIADRRAAKKLADLKFRLAEKELELLETLTPMDLATGSRNQKYVTEDLKRYLEIEAPLAKKSADFLLKSAKNYLEYQEEEVRQLEKMYKADDLTEETEEIVLKRARDALEQEKFYYEMSKIQHDQAVKVQLPRQEESMKEAAKRLELKWEKAKAALPLALNTARLTLEKTNVERKRTEQKMEELLADREAMIVKAPIDGVVYYGKFVHGKFSGAAAMAEILRPHGTLTAGGVFMTIVQPRPMFIRTTVAEKQLNDIRPELEGFAQPTCNPSLNLPATVEEVDAIPFAAGSFGARLHVGVSRKVKGLAPGMGCKVKFIPYHKDDALTVPTKAVHTEESDPRKHYVYVVAKKGEPKKKRVTVGRRTSDKAEILKGLSEGNEVLLEKPKKKEEDEKK